MKLIFRVFLFVILTVGIIRTDTIFLKKPIFEVKDVVIHSGNQNLIKSLSPLKKYLIGKNINEILFSEIEERIARDVRVEEVKVKKVSMNKIDIEIRDKVPKCYVQYQNKVYIVDKNGEVFSELGETKAKDFPVLVINKNIEDNKKQLRILLDIFNIIEETEFKDVLSQIYIVSPTLTNMVLIDGTIVKTNKQVSKDKYSKGSSLFFYLSTKKKISYMDLRYNDYIVKYMEDKNGE